MNESVRTNLLPMIGNQVLSISVFLALTVNGNGNYFKWVFIHHFLEWLLSWSKLHRQIVFQFSFVYINRFSHILSIGSSVGKESACNAGELGSIPGLGRSPGEGNGNPLQYSCLENPMDRGTWWATVHGVTRVEHDLATKPPPWKENKYYVAVDIKEREKCS